VVQGEVQEVTLATPSRKKVQLSKRNGMQFWRVEKWRKYTIKYTCCKSKFAISKQKKCDFSKL
jgi:hypothetical protein